MEYFHLLNKYQIKKKNYFENIKVLRKKFSFVFLNHHSEFLFVYELNNKI